MTSCFLRLANLDNGALERLGRYETALWRQIVQTLLVLRTAQYRQPRAGRALLQAKLGRRVASGVTHISGFGLARRRIYTYI